ncbi:MAG: T9SS type A sorting domain-containing protein [Rhodothermaceae bacterium]|nr:T9SS type A sorting domain-containing protein [Rhodothermaceae bacterium]
MKKQLLTIGWILIAGLTFILPVSAQYAGGSGSVNNPYLVSSADQLDAVRENLEAHFKLIAHINLGEAPWNEEEGWNPIGSGSNPFKGSFDGNGFSILNLTIDRQDENNQGLFGYTNGAVLKNLELLNVNISGAVYTGAVVAQSRASFYDGIEVMGSITGKNNTGGAFGNNYQDHIHKVITNVNVSGTTSIGGLSGGQFGSQIRHSGSDGSVTGSNHVGGFIGSNNGSNTSLADSYSHASVTGTTDVGGFAGYHQTGIIVRCLSTGSVSNTSGGFVGTVTSGYINYSFWDTQRSGAATSEGGPGVAGFDTQQMKTKDSYRAFNFIHIWSIIEGGSYPFLRNLSMHPPQEPADLSELSGNGSISTPYIITNAYELQAMNQNPEASYILANDIDLSATVSWNYGLGFSPVGTSSNKFTGSFDGKGHTIQNLNVNRPDQIMVGLFGDSQNAVIQNVTLANLNIMGSTRTGGIIASTYENMMQNLHANGLVVSTSTSAGGILGSTNRGLFFNGSFVGHVFATSTAGGLIGAHFGTDIRMAFSRGTVNSAGRTNFDGIQFGGLSGQFNSATMTDVYSHSEVTGREQVGGLIGYFQTGKLERAFSTGRVTGQTDTGGLIGLLSHGTITYSFWDTDVSNQSESAGGSTVVGLTTLQLKDIQTYRMFNFSHLWMIKDGMEYPEFQDISHFNLPHQISLQDLQGNGTESSPYIIYNLNQMQALHLNTEAHFRLGNDIDMSSTLIWNYGKGWTPAGTSAAKFSGRFDGQGYVLSNLSINEGNLIAVGLFGYAQNAELVNITIENGFVTGGTRTGMIAGDTYECTNENHKVSGIVHGESIVGGIFGSLNRGTLSDARVVADIYGKTSAGGLSGAHFGTTIHRAFSRGNVTYNGLPAGTPGLQFGGLLAHLNSATIYDSFSHANVTGGSDVGGLVGYKQTGDIRNSYSKGHVQGIDQATTGGLIGRTSYGNIYDSFWDMESSGQSTSATGTGRTTEEMTWPYNQNTYGSWNFTDIWAADNQNNNDGYPYLKANVPVWYDVNISSGDGGIATGDGSYLHGSIVTLKATPDEGWVFEHWSEEGDIVSVSSSYTFTATKNRTLTASFGIYTHTDSDNQLPKETALYQNYPNPFNPATIIRYSLPEAANVKISVYNITGQRVADLVNDFQSAGNHSVQFNATHHSSGLYVYMLQTDNIVITRKMILIK